MQIRYRVINESGVVCYQYGNMGEVTGETRIYALPFLTNVLALSTQFGYDSWGRVDSIIYPDNETVKYRYDCGGQLQSIYNRQVPAYSYLDNVTYDRFGAKVSQEYGNGLNTQYSYDNTTRRLSQISVTDNSSNPYSDIQYGYDLVGNVTQVTSTCPWLQNQNFMESFTYDAADQLTAATEMQNQSYQLAVTYGNWGKVNTYDLTQTDLLQNITTQNAYTLTYPTDPDNPQDAQTNFAPTMQLSGTGGTQTVMTQYTFGINGSLRKKEHIGGQQPVEYFLFNSASNLKAYSYDKTDFAYYGYNAANTRTYKLSCSGTAQWRNGILIRMNMQLQQAMFYPNAYINFNHNGEYTKHYYNGSERIASRLGTATPNISTTANGRLIARTNRVGSRFRTEVKELIYETAQVNPPMAMSITSLQSTNNTDIFYYHTNHLGSTAFVTDQNQNVTQGFLYAPFGEITTEFNANFGSNVLPKYSFNAKELDEETGMYYYEARYYKPPVFTSRDAIMEKKPWLTPYHYCSNNPMGRVDPSGMLDGDYFDLQGNYLGNDGIYDGKVYVVTDDIEVGKIIQKNLTMQTTSLDEVNSAIDLHTSAEIREEIIDGITDGEKINNLREYGGIVRKGEYIPYVDWGKPGKIWDGFGKAEFDYNTCEGEGEYLMFFHSHFPGEATNGNTVVQTPSEADCINVKSSRSRQHGCNVVISTKNNSVYLINNSGKYFKMSINVFISIQNEHTPKSF